MTAIDIIDAYLTDLRLAGRSDYTIRTWSRILRHADRELPHGLDQAAPSELAAWIARGGLSQATRFSYFTALSRFYVYATTAPGPGPRGQPWLLADPMQRLPRQRMPAGIPHPVTEDELQLILTHVAGMLRVWALLAAYAGTRCIEVSRLDREHITADVIRVLGKGDKPGTIPTHPLIWEAVQQLPPGPVAVRDGQRMTGPQVSAAWRWWVHRTFGRTGLGLHRLRHWCLTRIQEAHGDLRLTQEIARHASPATTARYTLVAGGRRAEAVRALPTGPAGSAAPPAGPAHPPR